MEISHLSKSTAGQIGCPSDLPAVVPDMGTNVDHHSLRAQYNSTETEVAFMLLAQPWWVNLLVLIPVVSFYFWRRHRLAIEWKTLVAAAAFAAAFGFVEAACVDYLRGNLPSLQSLSIRPSDIANPQALHFLPDRLLKTEIFREAATIIMLIAVPLIGARRARERWALFLWCFSIWDLVYYVGLWATIHWPTSLRDIDVLFLIPRPWFAELWYPVLVSAATMSAVMFATERTWGRHLRKELPSEPRPNLPNSALVGDMVRESMPGPIESLPNSR